MATRRKKIIQSFETQLLSRLRQGHLVKGKDFNKITGDISLGTRRAKIEIVVSHSLNKIFKKPPPARCLEDYMKDGEEWHNCEKTGMCYVLAAEWEEYLNWKDKKYEDRIKEAVDWLIAGVTNLICRHRIATKRGYTEWPDDWNFWKHGSDGYEQYLAEKNERKGV